MSALIFFSDNFLTKFFPDKDIPWAAWSDRSRIFRYLWKFALLVMPEVLTSNYY